MFLGRSVTQHKSVSDDTARRIDEVVRGILDKAYGRTTKILIDNLDKLHAMAKLLLEYETIDVPMIDAVRSEEHTSELQSLMRISYAVFCLKKKNNQKQRNT